MPFIYLPACEHVEYLVDTYAPEPGRSVPSGGRGFWDWHYERRASLEDGYVAMQLLSEREQSDRHMSRDDVLKCLKGRVWMLRALLAPLPDRPPLLHAGCEPCPLEGCSRCLGGECVCSTGTQNPESAYRICINR